jgi:mRNA interferase RelE/StbE
LAWKIEFLPAAAKELRKLDRQVAARIIKTLEERIAPLDDPRSVGSALVGEHAVYWRWRIGDYRVVARIEDERVTVLVVRVTHRREVYR